MQEVGQDWTDRKQDDQADCAQEVGQDWTDCKREEVEVGRDWVDEQEMVGDKLDIARWKRAGRAEVEEWAELVEQDGECRMVLEVQVGS